MLIQGALTLAADPSTGYPGLTGVPATCPGGFRAMTRNGPLAALSPQMTSLELLPMRWIPGVPLLVFVLGGCSVMDPVGAWRPVEKDAGSLVDAGGVPDAGEAPDAGGVPDAGEIPDAGGSNARLDFCARPGPLWLLNDPAGSSEICGARLASAAFEHGVHTCLDLESNARLTVDTLGQAGGTSAPVRVTRQLLINARMSVAGPLTVASTDGIELGGFLDVNGELRTAGSLLRSVTSASMPSDVTVGASAYIGGDVRLRSLTIPAGGALNLPSGKVLAVDGGSFQVNRGPVPQIAPSWACAALAEVDDVENLVANHASLNHNALRDPLPPLSPEALVDFSGDAPPVELPCGRFYLAAIRGTGLARIQVRGRAALFVGGDVDVGRLEISLDAGAELDLFITGGLLARQRLVLGDPAEPWRLRVYVGGDFSELPPDNALAGQFFAPRAQLNQSPDVDLRGALLVESLISSGNLGVHYDPRVRELANACVTPPRG